MRVAERLSTANLIFPFLFEADEFPQRVEQIKGLKWPKPDGKSVELVQVWTKAPFPTEDLLAPVADYLNQSPTATSGPTAYLWRITDDVLKYRYGIGTKEDKWAIAWLLKTDHGDIPFVFDSCSLALFHSGVGFLTFCLRPQGTDTSVWLDFLHFVRFFGGRRSVPIYGERGEWNREKNGYERLPFFPQAAGGSGRFQSGVGSLGNIIDALLGAGEPMVGWPGPRQTKQWWKEVYIRGQLLPHAVVYIDDAPEKEQSEILFRLRNFFHSTEGIPPGNEGWLENDPGLLLYAPRQYFFFSLGGGGFAAFDAPSGFSRDELPSHLATSYFLIHLLTMHQRFTLIALSQTVAKNWPLVQRETSEAGAKREGPTDADKLYEERLTAFQYIRDALLTFTARGYLVQAVQRDHHHRCYRRWREIFELDRLYERVHTEVQEMYEYLSVHQQEVAKEHTERLERMIAILGFLIGFPALFGTLLGVNMRGWTLSGDGLPPLVAIAVVFPLGWALAGVVLLLVFRVVGRRKSKVSIRRE